MSTPFPHPFTPGCCTGNPAPSVITIDRADLPEVLELPNGREMRSGNGMYGYHLDAAGHREQAIQQLAVAEFLEAREAQAAEDAAAEKLAIDKRDKRRDELAREHSGMIFAYLNSAIGGNVAATLIDRIIELEDAANVRQ